MPRSVHLVKRQSRHRQRGSRDLGVIDWGCSKGPEKCLCERGGGGGFFLWPGLVFV